MLRKCLDWRLPLVDRSGREEQAPTHRTSKPPAKGWRTESLWKTCSMRREHCCNGRDLEAWHVKACAQVARSPRLQLAITCGIAMALGGASKLRKTLR